jgi:hypothetical protein
LEIWRICSEKNLRQRNDKADAKKLGVSFACRGADWDPRKGRSARFRLAGQLQFSEILTIPLKRPMFNAAIGRWFRACKASTQ